MTNPSAVPSPNREEDSASHSSYHSYPSGSRTIRTARRTTRSPRVGPYPIHATSDNITARARLRAVARQWGWLPVALATWRIEHDIQITDEVEGPSNMDISPYTQEPVHLTVPVLAARVHRHESRLHDMEIEQHETRSSWMNLAQGRLGQIYQDQEDLAEAMDIARDRMEETRGEVAALRLRLAQCEQRLTLAEENARQASSLAESVNHLITLLPQVNLRQD